MWNVFKNISWMDYHENNNSNNKCRIVPNGWAISAQITFHSRTHGANKKEKKIKQKPSSTFNSNFIDTKLLIGMHKYPMWPPEAFHYSDREPHSMTWSFTKWSPPITDKVMFFRFLIIFTLHEMVFYKLYNLLQISKIVTFAYLRNFFIVNKLKHIFLIKKFIFSGRVNQYMLYAFRF